MQGLQWPDSNLHSMRPEPVLRTRNESIYGPSHRGDSLQQWYVWYCRHTTAWCFHLFQETHIMELHWQHKLVALTTEIYCITVLKLDSWEQGVNMPGPFWDLRMRICSLLDAGRWMVTPDIPWHQLSHYLHDLVMYPLCVHLSLSHNLFFFCMDTFILHVNSL